MDIQCAICLENCNILNSCLIWWCEHIFHTSCITTLLKYNKIHNTKNSCPLCRTPIERYSNLDNHNDLRYYYHLEEHTHLKNINDKQKLFELVTSVLYQLEDLRLELLADEFLNF